MEFDLEAYIQTPGSMFTIPKLTDLSHTDDKRHVSCIINLERKDLMPNLGPLVALPPVQLVDCTVYYDVEDKDTKEIAR